MHTQNDWTDMPRPQTPFSIAEATGAAEHNPGRYTDRKQAPQPQGPLGEPPNHFDDVHRDLWNEVAAMPPPGVLTSADRILVEIAANLLYRLRKGGSYDADENMIFPLSAVELGHLRSCLGSMGCTPADRGRVSNAQKKTASPLGKLKVSGRAN